MQTPSTTLPQPPETELRSETSKKRGKPPNLVPSSTIGSKYVVGITGLALSLFVFFHMVGNLQVFLGPAHLNGYAAFLKNNIELLWVARVGLLVFFIAHLYLALRLQWMNRSARSQGYAYQRQYVRSNIASRTMLWSGLALLFFLIYHLAHFTLGFTNPDHFGLREPLEGAIATAEHGEGRHDVYSMVVWGFRNPLISGAYVVAMIFLGLHMWHGVASTFQSLGINEPKWRVWTRNLGHAWTWIVVVGNIAMPVIILLDYYAGLNILVEPRPLPGAV